MKKSLLLACLLFSLWSYSQTIELFTLNQYTAANTQKTGFISLSDKYDNEKFLDSIGILPEKPSDIQHVPLAGIFRKRLLEGTKITEKDTVYLYNYATNAFVKTPVSSTNTIAKIGWNFTKEDSKNPINPNEFMYGLEVNEQVIKEVGYEAKVLVYIGASNPFKLQKLQPFVWKKISAKEFPFSKLARTQPFEYKINELKFHYYKSENYQYYMVSETLSQDLVILDLKGNKVNEITFGSSESCSLAPLSEDPKFSLQFVGALLHDLPEAFLGFYELESSISCTPIIDFVDPHYNYISINNDYKHKM